MTELKKELYCLNSPSNLSQGLGMASAMQQRAIRHLSGPARILAGPGSGKTFVIIQRICLLIDKHKITPNHILCLTFTKAAACEMQMRFRAIMRGYDSRENAVCFGTIHSICYHILKDSGEFRQYSLISDFTKRKYMLHILKNKGFSDGDFWMTTELLNAVSRKKNGLDYRLQEMMEEHLFEEIFTEYQKMLQQRKYFDFDDMLEKCYTLLKKKQSFLLKWQQRFEHVLVDEFQDINMIQYEIIRLLAMPQNNLFVVGDDDQAIYGFRGALPDIMKRFTKDYPEARHLFLTENYRSGNKITVFASQIIAKNKQRLKKEFISVKTGGEVKICHLPTRREQEKRLIADIKKLSCKEAAGSAVILRTNREVLQYTDLFNKNGIKIMKTHKRNFNLFHNDIADDMKAFICFCKEGYQRNFFRKIMNKPEHFLSELALTEERISCQTLNRYYQNNKEMQKKIEKLFEQYGKVHEMSYYTAIRYFRNIIGYDRYLKDKAKNLQEYEMLMSIAGQLTNVMMQHVPTETCELFFERMENLYSDYEEKTETEEEAGLRVITMHVAKGMEFETVFLPDINEGVIPDRQCMGMDSEEEERRLLYVAVTRARKNLHIYYTRERGREASRFIREFIPHQ